MASSDEIQSATGYIQGLGSADQGGAAAEAQSRLQSATSGEDVLNIAKQYGWSSPVAGAPSATATKASESDAALASSLKQAQQNYANYMQTQRDQVSKLQAYLNDRSNLEAERQLAVATAQRKASQEYAARGLSQTTHMSNAMERLVYESQAKANTEYLNRQTAAAQLGMQWAGAEAQAAQQQLGTQEWMASYQQALVNAQNQYALQKQQLQLQAEAQEGSFWDTLTGIVGLGTGVASAYSGFQTGSYYSQAAKKLGGSTGTTSAWV